MKTCDKGKNIDEQDNKSSKQKGGNWEEGEKAFPRQKQSYLAFDYEISPGNFIQRKH